VKAYELVVLAAAAALSVGMGCGSEQDPGTTGGAAPGGGGTGGATGGAGGTAGAGGSSSGQGGSGGGYVGSYTDLSLWACHPDSDDSVCDEDLTAVEVLPDGSTAIRTHQPATSPVGDCFYVYPTVDLSLTAGNHDDLTDDEDARRTTLVQAGRLTEQCRVFAPLYRQATLGTFLQDHSTVQEYFDIAYGDVLDAFEYYLAEQNDGRPFIVIGHSQGGQISSRLVRERIETDPAVLGLLAGVMPIGWPVATDSGGSTGGSFATVPVCTSAADVGCAVSYRSYAAQNGFIPDSNREGDVGICVHPGDVPSGGPALLSRTYLPADLGLAGDHPTGVAAQAPFVLYSDLYRAHCVEQDGSKALAVELAGESGDQRSSPLDFDKSLFKMATGTHIYDVHFGLGDLIDLVGTQLAAHGTN